MVNDLRKDDPPKLDKKDPKKFNLDDLKDKASIIKDNHLIGEDTANRPPKLGKLSKSKPDSSKSDDKKDSTSFPAQLGKTDNQTYKRRTINNKLIFGVIGLIAIIIAGSAIADMGSHNNVTANKTNNTNSTPVVTVNQNHFDNGIISFDYPQGWYVVKQQVQAPLIVTVQKDPNNSFSIFSQNLSSTSFSNRVDEWKQSISQTGQITSEGNITMDGVNGYDIEATYNNGTNNNIYNTRGVVIDKNQTAYFIIFIFNSSPLDYKDQMDQVINSFHVK